ncbi:MAG: tetratricopeptide repeat protein [Deltaproteobacteria bacterium]|nr:tetratricopeptide repeat protein [Deltaproteobacteria bacterium]
MTLLRSMPACPLCRSLVVLWGAVLLAYANSFRGDFQFDDIQAIVNYPPVHSLEAWWAAMPGIRPLLKLSYALNWSQGLAGYHTVNLLLHMGNVSLVFLLARRFLQRLETPLDSQTPSPQATAPRLARREAAALVTALWFGLHPALSEAVTYITGRSASLCTLFYLGSLLAYAHWAEARSAQSTPLPGEGRPHGWKGWYGFSLGLFLCALLTKEMAVTLPGALLLWEAATPRRQPWSEIWKRQVGHWAVLGVMAAALLGGGVYQRFFQNSLELRPLKMNLINGITGYQYLLGLLAGVQTPNLAPLLPYSRVLTPGLMLGWGAAGVWLAVGFLSLRRAPVLGFALLWFPLILLPTLSVFPRAEMANDRHVYLAAVGPLLLLGWAWGWALTSGSRKARRWVLALLALGLAALTTATLARNEEYKTPLEIWRASVRAQPTPRGWNNLGWFLEQEGDLEGAKTAYQQALDIDPRYYNAKLNLQRLQSEEPRPFPGQQPPAPNRH